MSAAATLGRVTIVLKARTYHTAGVVLSAAHSNLTIQNQEGGDVVISGDVPVVKAKRLNTGNRVRITRRNVRNRDRQPVGTIGLFGKARRSNTTSTRPRALQLQAHSC